MMAGSLRRARWLVAIAALAAASLVAFKIIRGNAGVWLPGYLTHLLAKRPPPPGTRHLLFLFVDHYEPDHGGVAPERGVARNREWLARYRALADRHRDSYGRRPQHTWFYAAEQHNDGVMQDLSRAVHDGYGEIELHWHHGNDTNETAPPKLRAILDWFASYGALVSASGKVSFGFIHGNWTLDDSGTSDRCGVRRELDILKAAGCYADFTFPAAGLPMQPRKVNGLYYARDDDQPKSYDTGVDAAVGRRGGAGLLIFEGPLGLRWSWHATEAAGVEDEYEPAPARVDDWVASGIGVAGRPEWTFVKIHTHGIQSRQAVLGEAADRMLTHLEQAYGRAPWRLHYVTAREAFNIVRAAEEGRTGDPEQYLDFEIEKPRNRSTIQPSR